MGELSRLSSLLGFLKDRALPSAPTTDSISDLLRAVEKRAMVTTFADSLGHALGLRGDAASATGSLHAKAKDIRDNMSARPTAATYNATSTGAPAASAIPVDSGALAAGEYEILAFVTGWIATTSGARFALQHRNAANSANIREHASIVVAEITGHLGSYVRWPRITFALDERIRIAETAAVATNVANIITFTLFVRAV